MQPDCFTYVRHRWNPHCNYLPFPMGPLHTYECCIKGLRIHNDEYVRNARCKSFLKYQHWWLEMSDELFRRICPCDLNGMPCPFDELGGCRDLRLCSVVRNFPHPQLGAWPQCQCDEVDEHSMLCKFIHHILPTCRSLQKQVAYAGAEEQFRSWQTCNYIAGDESGSLSFCAFGHDFESARIEAVWRYWEHVHMAQMMGARTVINCAIGGQPVWAPLKPSIETLTNVHFDHRVGKVKGVTFHGNRVSMSMQVYCHLAQRSVRHKETVQACKRKTTSLAVFDYRDSPETLRMYNTNAWMRSVVGQETKVEEYTNDASRGVTLHEANIRAKSMSGLEEIPCDVTLGLTSLAPRSKSCSDGKLCIRDGRDLEAKDCSQTKSLLLKTPNNSHDKRRSSVESSYSAISHASYSRGSEDSGY